MARGWLGSIVIVIGGALAAFLIAQAGNDALALSVAIATAVVIGQRVQGAAGRRIAREVQGAGPIVAAVEAPAAASLGRVSDAGRPLSLEVVDVGSLPTLSAESRARFDAIRARGASLRRLYRRLVFLLALAMTALVFVAAWVSEGTSAFPSFTLDGLQLSERTDWVLLSVVVLLVTTLVILAKDAIEWTHVERRGTGAPRGALSAVTAWLMTPDKEDSLVSTLRRVRGGALAERDRWEDDVVPIRPLVVPLLGAAWLVLGAVAVVAYIGSLGIAFVIPAGLYVVALHRKKASLERRYPVYPPLKLLTLRVFSSPALRDFMLMTDRWRWLGPMQRLDGSDTAGSSMREVVAYLRGRVEDVIVRDERELAAALASFGDRPDGQLRYPLNSIQCNDATWKRALQAMLNDADAVVMDLSSFNDERRGCAYELGKLIEQIPLRRFILLVNARTDMPYLRRTLDDAWLSRPDGAVNAAADEPVHVLEIRAEAMKAPVDAERLVGALLDAASADGDTPAAAVQGWTRPGLPRFCSFL
jgi:hypothetical protein